MVCELDKVAESERDLLIVAGDTAEGARGHTWLNKQAAVWHTLVVQVMGNHEYYGHEIDWVDEYYEPTTKNLHTLQCKVFEHMGVRIAGCTLWTDMSGVDGYDLRLIEQSMADFHVIRKRGNRFTPEISQGINMQHRNWLLQQKDIDIVVTHHAPSWQSVTPYWQEHGKTLNPGFAGASDDIIEHLAPKYWIHGHMHSFLRYWHNGKVGGTQIICNPRGYIRNQEQENKYFNNKLLITIDK